MMCENCGKDLTGEKNYCVKDGKTYCTECFIAIDPKKKKATNGKAAF